MNRRMKLLLDDGSIFYGRSFGYEAPTSGEVVFNTAMVGYPESLTDPSYSGQILCVTFPLVGNYGVPEATVTQQLSSFYESERIHVKGLIISNYSTEHSHWNASKSLSDWLKEEKVTGLCDIDTRELTKRLREHGSMLGRIVYEDANEVELYDPNTENQVAKTSCTEVITYNKGKDKRIVMVDCGVKHNIIRCLLKRDVEVIRVPWDYDFNTLEWDGLFISNGPGDPSYCEKTVEHIRQAMNDGRNRPIFGICMGNQLLSKAAGASTFKLKYGHRSHNQPVRMVGTEKCYITSQNHGFAVDDKKLGADWEPLFVNMNDGTNEGIRHNTLPYFSAQFHPEAASGPTDTEFLFDDFLNLIK